MEYSSFVLKSRMLLIFTVIATMLSGPLAHAAQHVDGHSEAPAAGERVDLHEVISIARVKDKDGNWVDVSFKPSSREALDAARPSQLFTEGEKFRVNLRRQCGGNAVVKFAKSFPVESASFNLAVGMSAGEQAKEDPAYARHFVEQSVLDPLANAAFAGFMLGNRAAANFMSMMNLTVDPCKVLKRDPLAPMEKFEQNRFQKMFRYAAGPIGMSVGLVVSDELHQAMADPNIRTCAALQIGKIHGDDRIKAAKQACDAAYEDWVLNGSGKIRDLVPDMISMSLVTGIISAPQMGTAAIEKYITKKPLGLMAKRAAGQMFDEAALKFTWMVSTRTLLVNGSAIVMTAAREMPFASPLGRVAVAIGSFGTTTAGTYVFLKLNDLFSSPIKNEFQTIAQGSDIEKSLILLTGELKRVQANHWVYSKDSALLRNCDLNPAQAAAVGAVFTSPGKCYGTTKTPVELIRQLGKQEKKWRDFIMGDTSAAAANWRDYVMKFANTFSDARKFYLDILRRVWGIQNKKGADDLNAIVPLWGVPVANWTSGQICDIPQDTRTLFDYAAAEVDEQIKIEAGPSVVLPTFWAKPTLGWDGKSLHPKLNLSVTTKPRFAVGVPDHYDVKQLKTLREGFMAMDCRFPLANVARDLHKDEKQATAQEIENLRKSRYNKAVSLLYWELLGRMDLGDLGLHSDRSLPIDDPAYEDLSASNLYMRVNLILGAPQPMYPGVTYLKTRRDDETDINKDMRDLHPMELRGVATKQMPDYLLASMVCGPTANKAITQINVPEKDLKIAKWKVKFGGGGWSVNFEPPRIVPNLGYDLCQPSAAAQHVMVANSNGAKAPLGEPHMSVWNVKGKNYQGLLEVVKAFADPAILGGPSSFEFANWWNNNLNAPAEKVFESFRMRFIHDVIEKQYLPALSNPSYSSDKHWIVVNSMGLPKGLNNAMTDSLKEHLALLQAMVIQKGSKAEDIQKFNELSETLIRHLTIGLQMIGPPLKTLKPGMLAYIQAPDVDFKGNWSDEDRSEVKAHSKTEIATALNGKAFKGVLDDAAFNAYKLNAIDFKHAILNMQSFAYDQAAAQGPAKATLLPLIDAITENLGSLVTDLDAYHGFLVSVRLD